jgi:bacterioferritin-associated ferredoxin
VNAIDNHSHLHLIFQHRSSAAWGIIEAMYVCVCNAVTDSQIREAVADGVTSFQQLSAHTGCSSQCGRCMQHARSVMDAALAAAGAVHSRGSLHVVRVGHTGI